LQRNGYDHLVAAAESAPFQSSFRIMTVDRAIDEFVTAASSPQCWSDALEVIAESLGAAGATLTHGASTEFDLRASRSLHDIVGEYFFVGAPIDTREHRVKPATCDNFVGDFDSFTPEEIARDPFYAEFLRPRGFGWHATAALTDGAEPIYLNLKRRWTSGPYQRDELQRISKALPHFRAAAHHARIALRARSDDQLANLSAAGKGGALIDVHGAVLRWNEQMVFGDGIGLRDGRLVSSASVDQGLLDQAINRALAIDRPSDLPPAQPCLLRRPSGRRPLILRVTRLFAENPNPVAEARALVSVSDPALARPNQPQLLRALFGLTPREADIAILLEQGRSLAEIAELSRISLAHARQRLKVILHKTDTTRQGELISLLSRTLAR
jgi:DNA-binding CsgD family transcriptional regulator